MSLCYELFKTFSVIVVGIQIIFGVLRWMYENVIGPTFLEPTNLKKFGNWALVTGATDGIGKQYAFSLAKRGLNIILVSRTLSKLEDVAMEISKSYNVETHVIVVDFMSGPEIYNQIKEQIVGKEIGILVNNVGISYELPNYFLDIPDREKFIQDVIKCNVTSVAMMCSVILPQMDQRKSGLIINISSLAAVTTCPTLTVYAASKAFVTKFSDDLAAEYSSQGINVQVLFTGVVSTKMTRTIDAFSVPTAKKYVESALSFVGYARSTTGFLPHTLLYIITRTLYFIAPSFTERLAITRMREHREKLMNNPNTLAKLKVYF